MKLSGKQIGLGVCGSIAAYKSPLLLRQLQELGAEVQVLMTPSATRFVGSATFQALSGRPVFIEEWEQNQGAGMAHIDCARYADLLLIAPASANTLAKLAHGIADNALTAACLASQAPLALAPAMNQAMWSHPATLDNLEKLRMRGALVWGPDTGRQACGDLGEGRLSEPAIIVRHIVDYFSAQPLAGKRVVITAGATQEAIDEVRYLSNRSSGKMGFALAQAACRAGAETILITAPTALPVVPGVRRIDVVSAEEMRQSVFACLDEEPADWFIGCAAVADYCPAVPHTGKIKKTAATMNCRLVRTRDIIVEVARTKQVNMTVGFAAETEKPAANAESKRIEKGLDVMIANEVGNNAEYGFGHDSNQVEVCSQQGVQALGPMPKTQLAGQLIDLLYELYLRKINDEKNTAHRGQSA